MTYVENVPTKKKKKEQNPRLSGKIKHSGRKERPQTKESEGKKEAFGVVTTRFFVIKRRGSGHSPLFVSVGKNVSKKAVDRNLIKRRVRSIFSEKKKNDGKCYSIIVKPEAGVVSFQELRDDLERVFRQR